MKPEQPSPAYSPAMGTLKRARGNALTGVSIIQSMPEVGIFYRRFMMKTTTQTLTIALSTIGMLGIASVGFAFETKDVTPDGWRAEAQQVGSGEHAKGEEGSCGASKCSGDAAKKGAEASCKGMKSEAKSDAKGGDASCSGQKAKTDAKGSEMSCGANSCNSKK